MALPGAVGLDQEKMGANQPGGGQVRQGGHHQYHGGHQGGYGDGGYYGGWMGGDGGQHYNNQINYYQQQQQYQYQPQPQQHYGYYQHQPEDMYMSQPPHHHLHHPHHGIPGPGRSPSGSHSTPSPHSQTDMAEEHHFSDIKRPQPPLAPDSLLQQQHQPQPPVQNVVKKPKPSRRKKKRDPNEPTKPVSAYALFFRDRQASIKGRNPNLSFGEVSKLVASMWDNLDAESKAHYKKRTEMAKKEYLRQLAAYRSSIVAKGHGDDMYGYMGYGANNYHLDNGAMVQNIPPHPHPAQPHPHQKLHPHPQLGAATYVTNSQDYMNQYQQQQVKNILFSG